MLRYNPKQKVTNRKTQEFIHGIISEIIQKATQKQLKIEKIIDKREEQQTFAVQSISENHTRQEGKTQA